MITLISCSSLAIIGLLEMSGQLGPAWGMALALGAAGLTVILYWPETRGLSAGMRWLLPLLRAAAIALLILMLLGPVWLRRREVGTRGEVTFAIDTSASMRVADVPGHPHRLAAVWETLGLDPERADGDASAPGSAGAAHREYTGAAAPGGLLDALSETHRVRVVTTAEAAGHTDLAELLTGGASAEAVTGTGIGEADASPLRSVVLISDGQNNRGEPPREAASTLARRGIGVATLGVGQPREPTSLAVLEVRHPDRIDPNDIVRGYLRYKRVLPGSEPVCARIRTDNGRTLWEETIAPEAPQQGRLNFAFPATLLAAEGDREDPDRAAARGLSRSRRVITLAAELDVAGTTAEFAFAPSETRRDFALSIDQSSFRLLLLDGRSRWEVRYLRNVFERDPRWDVHIVLAGPGTRHPDRVPRGPRPGEFPSELHQLSDYEMIVVGEVPPDLLTVDLQELLVSYVDRGGALVLIDGVRGYLRGQQQRPLGRLVPVRWSPGERVLQTEEVSRTELGAATDWLQLEGSNAASMFAGGTPRRWEQLPAPHTLQLTEAKADAEVLLEAGLGSLRFPLLVHRLFGGGHVVYLASDETWRWRYGVADAVHAKFWNQLALGIMPPQLAVENEVGALDSGGPAYATDEQIPLRVRLRNPDGSFAAREHVRVQLRRDGKVIQSVPLESQGRVPGLYRGLATPLPPGNYVATISAAGYGDALDALQTRFTVTPARSDEGLQLALDERLLSEIAAAGQGPYVHLSNAEQLLDYLQPRTRGRIVESETSLWDSYFWFVPLVALLCLEWWLRKRLGLP